MKTKKYLLLILVFVFSCLLVTPVEAVNGGDLQPYVSTVSTSCSVDLDCKSVAAPYCNITYDLKGNYGTCEAVREEKPLQVIEGEECPAGTYRQLIYANEGSEAVCLKNGGG